MSTCLACECSPQRVRLLWSRLELIATDEHLPCMRVLTTARSALVEQARAEKRQRLAFSALAKAVQASSKAPSKASAASAKVWGVSVSRPGRRPGRIGGDSSSSMWLACTAEELSTLECCVAEAVAAVEEAGARACMLIALPICMLTTTLRPWRRQVRVHAC